MNVAVICVISLIILPYLPSWFVVVSSSMIGLISKNLFKSIMNGFLCGSIPWMLAGIYKFIFGADILMNRVGEMLPFDGWPMGMDGWLGALLVTTLVGGALGIMGGICGYLFKSAFNNQLIKS